MIFGIIFVIILFQDLLISLYCYRQKKKNSMSDESVCSESSLIMRSRCRREISCFIQGFLRLKLDFISKVPSHLFRKFFLKYVFHMTIGKKTTIYGKFEIRAPWNIYIGNGVIIGDEVKLDGRNKIYIGDNVNFSTGVWLWTEQHDMNDPYFNCNDKGGPIIIGNRVWLSNRVIILPNLTIGEGAVVAAGAVITKNCDSYGVYAGVPAKKIKDRNKSLEYEFTGEHYWFI